MSAYDARVILPHLLSFVPDELESYLAGNGIVARPEECRRVLSRAFELPNAPPRRRSPLKKSLLARVAELTDARRLEVVERVTDPSDGFVKYLFRSPDGGLSEAVRIPLHKAGRFTVCLSSQVGCAMGCTFCATGRLGLSRNLEAWEMMSAFLTVRDDAPGRVTGALFQGQGEPFHNYDEVMRTAAVLSHPCGAHVAGTNITISTVGLVPQIRRYTKEGHPYRLIVSLTSAVEARRRTLLPIAGRYGMAELASAVREYSATAKGRLTLAIVLMGGVNDGADEAVAIEKYFSGLPLRINLIDVNDARPDGFRRSTDSERHAFMDELQRLRAPIVRRYSGGAARHAACGMLAGMAVTLRGETPAHEKVVGAQIGDD